MHQKLWMFEHIVDPAQMTGGVDVSLEETETTGSIISYANCDMTVVGPGCVEYINCTRECLAL
jgi:hypothetical protein